MRGTILRITFFATVASLALVAAAQLPAAPPGGAYRRHPLVSDVPGAAGRDRPEPRQRLGARAQRDQPVVGRRQRHRQVDALHTGAGAINPARRRRRRRPDRRRVLRHCRPASWSARRRPARSARRTSSSTSEDGMIRGVATAARRPRSSPRTVGAGAIYKGLAIASRRRGDPLLYAADFHNARVDVFDGGWKLVDAGRRVRRSARCRRATRRSASRPSAHASSSRTRSRTPTREDEVAGQGRGFVDAYDLDGNVPRARRAARAAQRAVGPRARRRRRSAASAATCSSATSATDRSTPTRRLPHGVRAPRHAPRHVRPASSSIDGLWALEFGNAGSNGTPNVLFFTAGPNEESRRPLRDDHRALRASGTPAEEAVGRPLGRGTAPSRRARATPFAERAVQ